MGKRICVIDGCDKEARSRTADWCEKHYARWYKHGSPHKVVKPGPQPTHGPDCTAAGCSQQASTGGLCPMHYYRRQNGIPDDAPKYGTTDDIGYYGAHSRVRRERGPASSHPCYCCGGEATEWAFDNCRDESTRTDDGLHYSTDPNRYQPMCCPCHRKFDAEQRGMKHTDVIHSL